MSSSGDGHLGAWEVATGEPLFQIQSKELQGETTSLAWLADGKTLVAANRTYLKLFDGQTGKERRTVRTRYNVRSLALSPSGKLLAIGMGASRFQGLISLFDVEQEKIVKTFPAAPYAVDHLVWSSDATALASFSSPGFYRVWNVEQQRLEATFMLLDGSQPLVIGANGHYSGSGLDDELAYIALTDTGEQLMLTPAEFSKKYGWKNDPSRVKLK